MSVYLLTILVPIPILLAAGYIAKKLKKGQDFRFAVVVFRWLKLRLEIRNGGQDDK